VEAYTSQLVGLLTGHHAEILNGINHGLHRLAAIERALVGNQGQDVESWEVISTAPTQVNYQGRRHLLVWVNASVANLTMTAHGLSQTITLAAGWTVLDPPRDATLSLATGSQLLLFRATDVVAPGLI